MPVNTGAFRPPPGSGPGGRRGEGGAEGYDGSEKADLRLKESKDNDAIDAKYGFNRISDEVSR